MVGLAGSTPPLPSPAAFPPQRVSVSPVEEGVVTAGGQYTLQCNISRVATLAPSTLLEVMWLDPSNNTITSGTAYTISGMSSTTATTLTSTLTSPRLTTSQGGLYSCAVNMTIPDIVGYHQVISTAPVRVAGESGHSSLPSLSCGPCSVSCPQYQQPPQSPSNQTERDVSA